jgi:general secretion pathway protein K
MSALAPASANQERDHGFALLIVLWMLVLTSFLVALIAASGRTELRISSNLVANREADAAADGAIYQAIFSLLDPRPESRWRLDGSVHEIAIGDCTVDTRLQDEAARINPNLASPALLGALLRVIGRDPQSAQQLASAIGEWIGNTASPRPEAVMLADYRQSGRDYAPPGAPLQSLDELNNIVGMTPATVAAMRPHLSLFAPAEPNPARADPVVAAALAMIGRMGAPGSFVTASLPDTRTVRIAVIAHGPSNAIVTRVAIVKLGPVQPDGYAVVAWDAGAD